MLQARSACVPVDELKAPVFSNIKLLADVPAGATLVVDEDEQAEVAEKVGKLVLVISREQEADGVFYDGSQPFVLDGRKSRQPRRGVWFKVHGKGYAVYVWASASGATHRVCARSCTRQTQEARRRLCLHQPLGDGGARADHVGLGWRQCSRTVTFRLRRWLRIYGE